MIKKLIVFILVISTVMLSCSCDTKVEDRYETSFLDLFDTVTTIAGYSKDNDEFTKYSQIIYDELNEYNKLFDIYNDYDGINNIKTINDNAGIKAVKVDQKIIDLLEFSKTMYEKTDGKVNVAYGDVLSLWHDYREAGIADPDHAELPDMADLKQRAEHTDISKMIIDETASTVYLEDSEMSLDVGAVAKGYATELVAKDAQAAGFVNGMLSVGGNVRTIGGKFNDKGEVIPWSVGIQNPDLTSSDTTLHVLNITDGSLVTSGIYERYYTVDGKQYHHIIDPETLMPATYYVSVSIVCPDSGIADALSTSVFNMPYSEASTLIENTDDVEAMWVFADGTMKYSTGFEAMIER